MRSCIVPASTASLAPDAPPIAVEPLRVRLASGRVVYARVDEQVACRQRSTDDEPEPFGCCPAPGLDRDFVQIPERKEPDKGICQQAPAHTFEQLDAQRHHPDKYSHTDYGTEDGSPVPTTRPDDHGSVLSSTLLPCEVR